MDMEYSIQKLLEDVIKRSLFPRTTISVYVQVVCNDGSISFQLFSVRFLTIPFIDNSQFHHALSFG